MGANRAVVCCGKYDKPYDPNTAIRGRHARREVTVLSGDKLHAHPKTRHCTCFITLTSIAVTDFEFFFCSDN